MLLTYPNSNNPPLSFIGPCWYRFLYSAHSSGSSCNTIPSQHPRTDLDT